MSTAPKKLILVIGATGAQGLAVIDALLAPCEDGRETSYAVRALTRDPSSKRAQGLTSKGVECVKGSFDDFKAVEAAFEGVYGAWVNTDGFTVGEMKEIYAGMRIFEIAKRTPTVRHYVWSNLDYSFKKGGYDLQYRVGHSDGKGRVAEWMKAQPSIVSDNNMSWSVVTTAVYMEMLNIAMFGPWKKREDGAFVFASPIGNGHVPMIALEDVGFWARYTFDHRAETSTQNLEVASEIVGWDHLVETFARVTGQSAVYKRMSVDEWFAYFDGTDRPVANEQIKGDGLTTIKENFSGFWRQFRDNIIQRDMSWIKSVNTKGFTLERWMRETGYSGQLATKLLKNVEDNKAAFRLNVDRVKALQA